MTAERFLSLLGNPARPIFHDARIAVIVAHPDDETAALGCQFSRFPRVQLLHTTDGAPRRGSDYSDRGFATPADYAAARRAELEACMAIAEVPASALHCLWIPDQEAAHRLTELTCRILEFLREHRPDVVITLALEGGHPDHDATAFGVHCACRLWSEHRPVLIEVPLYHLGDEGWAMQSFIPVAGRPELILELDERLREQKRAMLAAHVSQAQVLTMARLECERFRVAPEYDFLVLPNHGRLLYEKYPWQMSGPQWLRNVEAALRELGLEG